MKTLVVGVKPGADRYANLALGKLLEHGHEVVALGRVAGQEQGVTVQSGSPEFEDIDTITLYLNASNQAPLADYFLSLKPRRIIFNPGAENAELAARAEGEGIEAKQACTLVMLSLGQF